MMSYNIAKFCLKQPIKTSLGCTTIDFIFSACNNNGKIFYLLQKNNYHQNLSFRGYCKLNENRIPYTPFCLPKNNRWELTDLSHQNFHSGKTIKSNNVPSCLSLHSKPNHVQLYSTSPGDGQPLTLTNKEKLKRAFKEYGATVVIFHITISLISLGSCYLAVSSGINMGSVLHTVGLHGSSEVASEAGLFVVAYAVHKVLAPLRIGITLAATPLIVRYLRKINILKPPKPKT